MANIISVSALNKYVKSILESDDFLTDIAIQGEISNFTRHYKTGHCYFSLKDATGSVKAVLFRSNADRLAFSPENGMHVIARCRVSLYERDGAFQIYVDDLFPDGVGAAQLAFEQLKQRLLQEGLFEGEYKKPLPAYPGRVGLVTSKTGAALQDILKVAAQRCPTARFLLAPVTVQGQAAAPDIADAITMLDISGLVDVIIVTRGGGSAEDLWVFNDERIARAAFAAKTPVVSAIGHEIDVTILDFVADMRAPTPSAAAEMVLPDLRHTMSVLMNLYINIANNMQFVLHSCYNKTKGALNHPVLYQVQNAPARNRLLLAEKVQQLNAEIVAKQQMAKRQMQQAAKLAASLNPYEVLGRGYAMVYKQQTLASDIAQFTPGDEVQLQLKQGILGCTVNTVQLIQENNSESKQ